MKHLRIIALVSILALVVPDAFGANWFQDWRGDRQQRQVKRHRHHHNRHHRRVRQHRVVQRPTDTTPVGAPLDGGLLAILGAAGVTYYIAKKKKKASTEN